MQGLFFVIFRCNSLGTNYMTKMEDIKQLNTLAESAFLQEAFQVLDLGKLDYFEAWEKQKEVHVAVAEEHMPQTLILVEHPPVITFGRKGGRDNLLATPEWLSEEGFKLYDIERGGDVTYHGPGQLVGYPIFRVGRRVRDYLRNIEQVFIQLLASYDINSVGSDGYAGVWVGDEKAVAIGVAIKRHVSLHGFALNVDTNLSHFETIVPCGIQDKGVTSLSKLLDRQVTVDEIKPLVIKQFEDVFYGSTKASEL